MKKRTLRSVPRIVQLLAGGGLLVSWFWGLSENGKDTRPRPASSQSPRATPTRPGLLDRKAVAAHTGQPNESPDGSAHPNLTASTQGVRGTSGSMPERPKILPNPSDPPPTSLDSPPFGTVRHSMAEAPAEYLSTAPTSSEPGTPPSPDSTPETTPLTEEPVRVPYASASATEAATIPAAFAPPNALEPIADGVAREPQPARDPSIGPTTSETAATEVTRAADSFLARLAGTPDDPEDPLRQQRWLEAQEASDARLRASLGGHAWMALHRDANLQQSKPQPTAPHPRPSPDETPPPAE